MRDGELLFASEPKALFAAGAPKRFDEASWAELMCFRFTAGEYTPLEGVKRLRPGHWMRWRDGEVTIERWWDLSRRAQRPRANGGSDAWFSGLFDDSVALERISDVPVGVLLSGGLDSGAVAASLATATGEHTETFTVRFPEPEFDEGRIAREVASAWELRANELVIPPESLLAHLRAASVLRDEPLAHSNEVHLWRISALAKPAVTVLLSGEGADETMGGYVRYQPLRYLDELLEARQPLEALGAFPLNRRMRKLVRFLSLGSPDDLVIFNACDVMPAEVRALGMEFQGEFPVRREFLEESRRLYPDEPVRQAMYVDQHAFLCSELDRNDRMTMGASIECRVPFLDYRLMEGLASLPSSALFARFRGKAILRRTSGERLPPRVLAHRKWGFGVPWSQYLRRIPELRQLVGMLPALEPIRNGPFMRTRVRALVDSFLRGDQDAEALVFQLVMIAIWHDAYIKG
jgi:asparagine synthase (glutamine-hydrolysing)